MKKILYSVFAFAIAAFTLTSCEDVPAPYDTPTGDGGGTELPEGVYIDQSFTSSMGDFTSVSESGTLEWYNDFSSIMVTGYQDFNGDGVKENQAGVTWLVSPEIDLTEAQKAYVSVNMAMRYERGDINENNSILISKDYTGNVSTATWHQLTYNTDDLNGTAFTFVDKNINIPADYLGGKVVIALRHTCDESFSSTWEVKSLSILEGEAEENPDTPDEPEVPADGTYIDETFSKDFGVFTVETIKGNPWIIDYSTAKATGYDNASKTTTPSASYIVSSPIDLSASKGATISFQYILRYVTNYGEPIEGINNKVLVTNNYTGDPSTTTWTDITGTLTEGRDWETWENYSAAIPTELIGKSNVVIALYYSCETSSGTWEVKNLTVKEGNGESGVTIDRDKTSINLNENMDNLVPASKISDLPTGWICGQVARDFVKTKTGRGGSMNIQEAEEFKTSKFFCKTDFDMEEIKKEEDGYVPLPKFYTFPSKEERERILYRNFVKVGQDVKEMIKDVVNKKGAR